MRARPSTVALGLYVVALGLLLFAVTSQIYLEWIQASTSRKLNSLRRYVPVACDPDPANHGRVVHIDCPIEKMVKFYPPKEFSWNLGQTEGLFFDTKVEMYQWSYAHTKLGLSCRKQWSENKEVGGTGWITSRDNPDYWPSVPGQGRQFPPRFYAGGFELDPTVISHFTSTRRLELTQDDYFRSSPVRPPQSIGSRNTKVFDDHLYTGDTKAPLIGDMRVSFYTSSATHVSAIGQQECRHGKCYLVPVLEEFIDNGDAAGWAKRDVEVDPDDRFGQAINVAKGSFDWMVNVTSPLFRRSPRIRNLDDEVIIVREGDHSGYKLLYDAVSGGKRQITKRWTIRTLVFTLSALIATWSYGIFHPNSGFSDDMSTAGQLLWLAIGGMGSGLFVSSFVASIVWLMTDILMGVMLMILALLGLGVAVYIGETVLEPEPERNRNRAKYEYVQMQEEGKHSASLPYAHIDDRSESSFYSPL